MTDPPLHPHSTSRRWRVGHLYLNDVEVGVVSVRGQDGSWGFGDFTPSPEFVAFASLFGQWSLLMHADEADVRLSEAASEELRYTERELDSLRAALLLENPREWHPLRQVNIDGPMIEWKE
ncbi:MAG TPA: hypothetical protein VG326_09250 [Tepidisphaeraceae bacterium]|jgi:hypothetical protein|nr:hypothetical protein [Tepidisphaeraceae bacterium]